MMMIITGVMIVIFMGKCGVGDDDGDHHFYLFSGAMIGDSDFMILVMAMATWILMLLSRIMMLMTIQLISTKLTALVIYIDLGMITVLVVPAGE